MPAFFPREAWDGKTVTTQTHGSPPSATEWDQFIAEYDQMQKSLLGRFALDFAAVWRVVPQAFTIQSSMTHLPFSHGRTGNAWDNNPFDADKNNGLIYCTGKSTTVRHRFLLLWMINWSANKKTTCEFSVAVDGSSVLPEAPARDFSEKNRPTCTNSYGIARVDEGIRQELSIFARRLEGVGDIMIWNVVFAALSIKAPRLID